MSAVADQLRRSHDRVVVRVRVAPLALLVTAAAAVRFATALLRPTPTYFPDEYMYASFGRSLAAGHLPVVRGAAAHFFPLLQPLLTAPAWLLPGAEAGYRATQAIESVAMSLAAIPVYYLARRLELPVRWALAAAAFSLAIPSLVYSSFVLSEPIAYPIVLAAVAAAVHAIDRPSVRSFALFLGLTGLAMFTRMQFAILLPCFVVVLVAVVLRERRLREFVRSHRVPLASLLVVAGALLAVGPARNTGYYPGFTSTPGFTASSAVHLLAPDALVLAFAGGFVLVPGAILGVGYALLRPVRRVELVFGVLTLVLTLGLFAEAIVYGHPNYVQERYIGHSDFVQERYLFYLLPLWTLAFLLYARRGLPKRGLHAILAVALVVGSLRLPLAGYLVGDRINHSPLLFAVYRLAEAVHSTATASLVVVLAGAAAIVALLAVTFLVPRRAPAFALAVALAGSVAASAGATSFSVRASRALDASLLGGTPSAVDALGTGRATMVLFPAGASTDATLFWNTSIDRLALLRGADQPDSFAVESARVARDGKLLVGGAPLRGSVLLSTPALGVALQNGTVLDSTADALFVRSRAPLRLRYAVAGSNADGWLSSAGSITVWPTRGRVDGRFVLSILAPPGRDTLTIRFDRPRARPLVRRVGAGQRAEIAIPLCSRGPVTIAYRARPVRFRADGFVAATLERARFVPGGC